MKGTSPQRTRRASTRYTVPHTRLSNAANFVFYVNELADLPERQQSVLRLGAGLVDGRTYSHKEIGDLLGISRERVRQIQAAALWRVASSGIQQAQPETQRTLSEDDLRRYVSDDVPNLTAWSIEGPNRTGRLRNFLGSHARPAM